MYIDIENNLTSREQQILELIVRGYTNKEMADTLYVSPKTVDTHRANLMRKLNVHKVTDLVWYAVRKGIFK